MSAHSIDIVPNLVVGQKRNGRCVYDREAKAELIRRCQQPGVSVAGIALAHGLNANLLRKWITVAERRGTRTAARTPALLPVMTEVDSVSGRDHRDGVLEVMLPGGTVRVHGRVSAEALRVAIDCLSRRA